MSTTRDHAIRRTRADRRGPNRATNVTRPAFGAAKSTPAAADSAPAPAAQKTGTTDEWESF